MSYTLSLNDEDEFMRTKTPPLRSASVDEVDFMRKRISGDNSESEFDPDGSTRSGESGILSGSDSASSGMRHTRPQRGKRRGRRRPRVNSEEPKQSKPLRRISKSKRNSLLSKFLGSSKGKNLVSGGGSTASGETAPNTADNASEAPEELHNSYNSNGSSPMFRSLTKMVRRNTLDSVASNKSGGWMSNQGSMSSNGAQLSLEEYKLAISNLQMHAEDLEADGNPDEALDLLQEALELADERTDTLSIKTEILCKLVVLHLFIANEQAEREASHEVKLVSEESNDGNRRQMMARQNSNRIKQGLKESVHHQAAKRYLNRIKPALFEEGWFDEPSQELVDFLCNAGAWELAILVTEELQAKGGAKQDFQQLATMHFQVACHKLDALKSEDALSHLQATATYLQRVPKDELDRTLYVQVLHLLANEYQSQQEYVAALETYKREMLYAPMDQQASLYCQMAQVHVAAGSLDDALKQIELAKEVEDRVTESNDVRSQILQTEGDVLFRVGRTEESLECYQQALHECDSSPADKAKLLYTMGKICVKLGRTRSAITYFTRELEITKKELGPSHLSVSRVLHELAKLYDYGLGEHKIALLKYNKALAVELANLQECHGSAGSCSHCNHETHELCSRHAAWKRRITAQIRETKKSQGRIYYKLGDFERAMKTSFVESSPAGRQGRRHSLY
ncbi:MAG: hypothetical protein SGBAC_006761 [Bacillariaceae sp.]